MPRKPRMYLPGVPCHVVQRGDNRHATFFAGDYRFYLSCLSDGGERYGVSRHAYVLMTNHVHLLVTPAQSDGVSRLMQSIGRRYVQYINNKYRRTAGNFSMPLGDGHFREQVERALGRRIGYAARGRAGPVAI